MEKLTDLVMDIMDSEEFENESVSIIVESDVAEELVNELMLTVPLFYEDTIRDVINILDENDIVSVSINRYDNETEELFVEPFLHDGVQFDFDSGLYLVQEDLLDVVEMDKLHGGELYVLHVEAEYEDEEQIEEDELYLEDCVQDFCEELLELDEEDCFVCFVKDWFEEIYEVAYCQAIADMED